MIEAFLNDPDPDGTLSLGPDMRKVQHSFSYFKRKILEKESERHQCSQQPPAATQREDVYFPHMSPVDVNSLKEMLQQRDNEISILVKMLKKEKKRADDAAVQLSRITDCQKLSSQSLPNYSTVPGFGDGMADTLSLNRGGQASSGSLTGEENMELGEDVSTLSKLTGQVASMCPLSQQLKSTPPQSRDGNVKGHQEDQRVKVYTFQESHEGNMNQLSLNHGGQVLLSMKKGSQLSAGKQEAFEIFIKDHEEQQIIEDHKQLIKKRSAEARTLSEQLNQVRNTIAELRKQLQTRRRQSAAQSVEVNQPPGEKFDPVEEELCEQIRREKIVYKSAIGRLKALSTEIEHLQLLLERVKVKIQKDFQKWWTQEASSLQGWEPGATAGFHTRPSSSGTPGLCKEFPDTSLDRRSSSLAQHARMSTFLDFRSSVSRGAEADINPPSEWRTLDSTSPPTGDQQVDADVLAFVRARQSLLSKNTAPQR